MAKKYKKVFADVLELPSEAICSVPVVTYTGRIEAIIENHNGLAEFSKEKICINTNEGLLLIRGENMDIKYMKSNCLCVSGNIVSVGYDM